VKLLTMTLDAGAAAAVPSPRSEFRGGACGRIATPTQVARDAVAASSPHGRAYALECAVRARDIQGVEDRAILPSKQKLPTTTSIEITGRISHRRDTKWGMA
jgi:hypothetical protein